MLRPTNRPILAYFDAIKNLRLRQLALVLKTGYDPNLMVNARGQNGLQFMIHYFWTSDAHFRLQAPINKAAYLSIAKLLLDSGLDPNCIDLLNGESVIFDAIRYNDKDMVSLLLNYVDFALRNKDGETALMCAARFGSKQVMRMILEHLNHLEMDGYFLRQRNRFGLTALELARGENLECAKVLTKHLITHGYHTGAALTRSSSHHQLVPRAALPYHMRPTGGFVARNAAALLDDDSGDEDFEADLLAGSYSTHHLRQNRPNASYKQALTASSYYDPKAAEFSQYLMEQQELAAAEQQQQQLVAGQNTISDEDNEAVGYYGAGAGTNLTRSRSCILAPSVKQQQQQQQQQQKYASGSKKADGKMAGTSGWDPSGAS